MFRLALLFMVAMFGLLFVADDADAQCPGGQCAAPAASLTQQAAYVPREQLQFYTQTRTSYALAGPAASPCGSQAGQQFAARRRRPGLGSLFRGGGCRSR